jgi:hypothetical protein
MLKIVEDERRDVLERTGVEGSEISPALKPAPRVEPSPADVDSVTDAADVEHGREPPTSPDGGDAGIRVDADVVEGAGQSKETEFESQDFGRHWEQKLKARQSASDSSGDTPQVAPEVARLEKMLNEQDPEKIIGGYQEVEPYVPLCLDSFEDAPEKDSTARPDPESRPCAPEKSVHQRESQDKATEPTDDDGSKTDKLCEETIKKLGGKDQDLSVEARDAAMRCCLEALLTEVELHHEVTMELADRLYDVDREAYGKCIKPLIKGGSFMSVGTLAYEARFVWNELVLARPCVMDDLGISDADEIALFDAALGAYVQYLQLTTEVRRSNWNEPDRNLKRLKMLAQVNGAAESCLKTYLGVMKDLRLNMVRKEAKAAEEAERQRQRPDRSRRPARTVEKSVAGKKILNEYEDANSAGRSPVNPAGESEVQS